MKLFLCFLFSFSVLAQISEEEILKSFEKVVSLYEKDLADIGLSYKIERRDLDATFVNMGVSKSKGSAIFSIRGNLNSKDYFNSGLIFLIACHEVGHILAEGPREKPFNQYVSEGESDYFATKSCLPRLYLEYPLVLETLVEKIEDKYSKLCSDDKACMASLKLIDLDAKFLKDANGMTEELSIFSQDQSELGYTLFNDYPNPKCRIQTLVNGALNKDRPGCWFSHSFFDLENQDPISMKDPRYEAMFFAKVESVEKELIGCKIKVRDISDNYFESRLYPLYEHEIYNQGLIQIYPCTVNDGDDIEGTASMVDGKIYYNLLFR